MSDLRTIKTDKLIKQAFIDLLAQKSFEQLTINDICDLAAIGRSTFYHHYLDKYALLEQLISDFTNEFQSLIEQRNQNLTGDSLLIYLYQKLFVNRQALLAIMTVNSKLEYNLRQILKKNSLGLFKKDNFGVPTDFLAEIYASDVLTAIIWTLKNGHSEEVAAFMNNSLTELMRKYLV